MGLEVAAGAMIVGAGSGIMSAKQQEKAAKTQNKAQKRANEIEQRRADIENQRQRRLAAMQAASGIAMNIASEASMGVSSSMAMGGNIGIESSLASSIGAGNTALAANQAKMNELQKGADKAMRYQNQANNWGAVSNLAGSVGVLAGAK